MKQKLLALLQKLKTYATRALKVGAATAIILAAVSWFTQENTLRPNTTEQYAKATVAVLNLQGNSGGTGVILHSDKLESIILTNRHVCGVVDEGGFIAQQNGRYLVTEFKKSNTHDLCLIKVRNNLKVNTEVAEEAPELYSEATVAGHPRLAPFTMVKGHFSSKVVIPIITGIRKCTPMEEESLETQGYCRMLGGMPVVEVYDSQYTSDTIQPGNSGSAVYNSQGQIAGLVFASNSRELSYSYIVPQEYVYNFVHSEARTLEWVKPHFKTPEERVNEVRRVTEKDLEILKRIEK